MSTSHNSEEPDRQDRFEPWPWMIGALLATMIAISSAFLAVAILHPDPDVREAEQKARAAAATSPPQGEAPVTP